MSRTHSIEENMQQPNFRKPASAFEELGFRKTFDLIMDEVGELYKADEVPWVVGYSGGKDSTATLQLVWMALARLRADELTKPVYVISTDTLVENPIVSSWVRRSLEKIDAAAGERGLPISSHQLSPDPSNSFWVNLLGAAATQLLDQSSAGAPNALRSTPPTSLSAQSCRATARRSWYLARAKPRARRAPRS